MAGSVAQARCPPRLSSLALACAGAAIEDCIAHTARHKRDFVASRLQDAACRRADILRHDAVISGSEIACAGPACHRLGLDWYFHGDFLHRVIDGLDVVAAGYDPAAEGTQLRHQIAGGTQSAAIPVAAGGNARIPARAVHGTGLPQDGLSLVWKFHNGFLFKLAVA